MSVKSRKFFSENLVINDLETDIFIEPLGFMLSFPYKAV